MKTGVRFARCVATICGGCLLTAMVSHAATLRILSADELIAKSDSIVVGHIVGAIQPVQLAYTGPGAPIFEYRARLLVTAVLAGKMPLGETPLLIHYGLRPVPLNSHLTFSEQLDPKAIGLGDTSSPVGLFECGTTTLGVPPSDDIRQDHLFFLRQKIRSLGVAEEDMDVPGIQLPQDLEPLKDRAYYEAVLKGDPAALAPYAVGDSWPAREARDEQDRLAVLAACRNPDLSARCDQLLAIWRKDNGRSGATLFAFDKILECGEVAAPKLMPVFQDPAVVDKEAAFRVWMKSEYKPAIPALIAFLDHEHKWWATRTPADQKYGAIEGPKGGPPYWDPRSVSFRNILSAVEVLEDLQATDARPVITATREQWKSVPLWPNNDLVGVCDHALASIH